MIYNERAVVQSQRIQCDICKTSGGNDWDQCAVCGRDLCPQCASKGHRIDGTWKSTIYCEDCKDETLKFNRRMKKAYDRLNQEYTDFRDKMRTLVR